MLSFWKSIILSKYGLNLPPGRIETGFPYLAVNCFSVSPSRPNALPATLATKTSRIQDLMIPLLTTLR
jgi:hypothetical protein